MRVFTIFLAAVLPLYLTCQEVERLEGLWSPKNPAFDMNLGSVFHRIPIIKLRSAFAKYELEQEGSSCTEAFFHVTPGVSIKLINAPRKRVLLVEGGFGFGYLSRQMEDLARVESRSSQAVVTIMTLAIRGRIGPVSLEAESFYGDFPKDYNEKPFNFYLVRAGYEPFRWLAISTNYVSRLNGFGVELGTTVSRPYEDHPDVRLMVFPGIFYAHEERRVTEPTIRVLYTTGFF